MHARLGRWSFHNRKLVVTLWAVALIGINVIAGIVGPAFSVDLATPGAESTDGFTTLEESFGAGGSSDSGSIVFQTDSGVDDPQIRAAMEALFAEVELIEVDTSSRDDAGLDRDDVTITSPYTDFGAQQVSPDRTVAFAQVNLGSHIDFTESGMIGEEITALLPAIDGLRIELGGEALSVFETPQTELVGVGFAIVVLIVAFGSVLAMGLPLVVALAGVATGGIGMVTLLSNVMTVPDFAVFIGLMIGIGVGIDYALFIVTRYRELTRSGMDLEEAVVAAMDTAGRAVVFAGVTVVVSLLGLLLIGLAFIAGLGIAAAITVATTMFASMTLLPALLGFAKERVEITRWRGLIAAGFAAVALIGLGLGLTSLAAGGAILAVATILLSIVVAPLRGLVPSRPPRPIRETLAYRWSRIVQARPILSLTLGAGVLVVLSLPAIGLRLGFSDEGNFAEDTTTRQAYDLVAEGFGPGFNGPFLVAVEVGDPADGAVLPVLVEALAADEGVASVSAALPSDPANPQTSDAFLIQVIPTSSPQDKATKNTVERLREDVIPPVVSGTTLDANVTGSVPADVDVTEYLATRLVLFFGVVLTLSFLLLMAVFRSLLVPLKAVIMNMLSIAAAYGVVVAIFQWGWFGSLTGIQPAPIEPFIPMMLFAIVFGLSMDYEVFLLSRIKEDFDRTGDAVNSVANGLAATARVITAAAAIMVVVFGSFLLEDDRIIQLFGTGLALAVLLDATLVRMVVAPSTMQLLGKRNWWFPRWLDRIIPSVDIAGSVPHEPHTESVDEHDREPTPVR
jgi:RND superfamily putative drug exporter